MTALVIAVFLASVLGSLHCVGMCGAFLALAFSDATGVGRGRLAVAYHGGRLVTYAALGVAAGTAGSLLDLGGALVGINRVALPLAGATLVVFGVVTLLRQHGVRFTVVRLPGVWTSKIHALQRLAMRMPVTRRALAIGLLTTLLPCGWLYAFAATAAGTASPWVGGLVMAVFWSGTLPALVSCGMGIQALAGPLGRRLPTLTCITLIVLGGWTLLGRAQLDIPTLARAEAVTVNADHPVTPACHPAAAGGDGPTFDAVTGCMIEPPGHRCGATDPEAVHP